MIYKLIFFLVFILCCKVQKTKLMNDNQKKSSLSDLETETTAKSIQKSFRDYQIARSNLPLQNEEDTPQIVDQMAQKVTEIPPKDFEILMKDPGIEALVIETHKDSSNPQLAALGAMSFVTAGALVLGSYGLWKGQEAKKVLARIKPEDLGVNPIQEALEKAQTQLDEAEKSLEKGIKNTKEIEEKLKTTQQHLEQAQQTNKQLGESLETANQAQNEAKKIAENQDKSIISLQESIKKSEEERQKIQSSIDKISQEKSNLESQITSLQDQLSKVNINESETEKKLKQEIKTLSTQIKSLQTENEDLKQSLLKSQEAMTRAQNLISGLKDGYQTLGKKTSALDDAGKSLEEGLKSLMTEMTSQTKQSEDDLKKSIASWKKQLTESVKKAQKMNTDIQILKSKLTDMELKNSETQKAFEESQQALSVASEKQKQLEQEIDKLKEQQNLCEASRDKIEEEIKIKNQALESAKELTDQMKETVSRMSQEITQAEESSQKLKTQLETTTKNSDDLKAKNQSLTEEIEKIGLALSQSSELQKELEAKHEKMLNEKNELDQKVSELHSNLEQAKRDIEKSKEELKTSKDKLSELEKKIQIMNAQSTDAKKLLEEKLLLEQEIAKKRIELNQDIQAYIAELSNTFFELEKKYNLFNEFNNQEVKRTGWTYGWNGISYHCKTYEVIEYNSKKTLKINKEEITHPSEEQKIIMNKMIQSGNSSDKYLSLEKDIQKIGKDYIESIRPILSEQEFDSLFSEDQTSLKTIPSFLKDKIGISQENDRLWALSLTLLERKEIKKSDFQTEKTNHIVTKKISEIELKQKRINDIDLNIKGILSSLALASDSKESAFFILKEDLIKIEKNWYHSLEERKNP